MSWLLQIDIGQVFQPWVQRRRLAYAKLKHVISGILQHLKQRALGRLLTDDGQPNEEVIRKLFEAIDENNDKKFSASELRALIIGIRFEEIHLDKENAVAKVMRDFDTSNDESIDENEFVAGVIKWLNEARRAGASASVLGDEDNYLCSVHRNQTSPCFQLTCSSCLVSFVSIPFCTPQTLTKRYARFVSSISSGIIRTKRHLPPHHYSLRIKQFSLLAEKQQKYESFAFEAGGYKWYVLYLLFPLLFIFIFTSSLFVIINYKVSNIIIYFILMSNF
ncbi:hypothetical protein K2173_011397 [Erythroxylum novogranatense]|uniref:Uncharacterized protein n=1 Tax=Erythroxylum novogranatense TaxID=1862640 RepID=A0AAV8S4R8_9ROSI|nr:hypothetical protein K2173_011397 [Erythroxylum novogranatense]